MEITTETADWNLYTADHDNPYMPLMEQIEQLYYNLDCPVELDENSPDTTTGSYMDNYWRGDALGDCDGKEDDLAEYLNDKLDEVQAILGLDGVSHYYSTEAWNDFVEQATDLINEFHEDNQELVRAAWDTLFGNEA